MLNYKGYIGVVLDLNIETGYFYGVVKYIRDIVTFQGRTVEELLKEFQLSVDDYLQFCEEVEQKPDKLTNNIELTPYTEQFNSNINNN